MKKIKKLNIEDQLPKSEIEILIDNYKKKVNNQRLTIDDDNEMSKFYIVKKLKTFCKEASLTTVEFIKLLDPYVYEKGTANLKVVEKTMQRLNVLDTNEITYFLDFLRKYYKEDINLDSLLMILEHEVQPGIDIQEEYPDLIIVE